MLVRLFWGSDAMSVRSRQQSTSPINDIARTARFGLFNELDDSLSEVFQGEIEDDFRRIAENLPQSMSDLEYNPNRKPEQIRLIERIIGELISKETDPVERKKKAAALLKAIKEREDFLAHPDLVIRIVKTGSPDLAKDPEAEERDKAIHTILTRAKSNMDKANISSKIIGNMPLPPKLAFIAKIIEFLTSPGPPPPPGAPPSDGQTRDM